MVTKTFPIEKGSKKQPSRRLMLPQFSLKPIMQPKQKGTLLDQRCNKLEFQIGITYSLRNCTNEFEYAGILPVIKDVGISIHSLTCQIAAELLGVLQDGTHKDG